MDFRNRAYAVTVTAELPDKDAWDFFVESAYPYLAPVADSFECMTPILKKFAAIIGVMFIIGMIGYFSAEDEIFYLAYPGIGVCGYLLFSTFLITPSYFALCGISEHLRLNGISKIFSRLISILSLIGAYAILSLMTLF